MGEIGLLNTAGQYGAVALLAIAIFVMSYRQSATHAENVKRITDQNTADIKALLERTLERERRAMELIDANTKALVSLTKTVEALSSMDRLSERISDLERNMRRDSR